MRGHRHLEALAEIDACILDFEIRRLLGTGPGGAIRRVATNDGVAEGPFLGGTLLREFGLEGFGSLAGLDAAFHERAQACRESFARRAGRIAALGRCGRERQGDHS